MLKLICLIIAAKAGIKNISRIDASSFELTSNLSSWKTEVDKLDI